MDAPNKALIAQDEITLREVLETLWRTRWHVLAITATITLAAAVAASVLPKTYKAEVLLSPVASAPESGQSGTLSSVISQFSGLASLAGISVEGDSRKAESVAVLQSEALTESYIRDRDLLPVLYPKLWDAQHQRWKVSNPRKAPTVWKAYQYFKRLRTVTTDTHGLVKMTIEWRDPRVAAQWANDLVRRTNDQMRDKAIAESDRNIAYLKQQAADTEVVELRQAIFKLMEGEIDREMIARGSDEYALKVLDPAIPPQLQSSPQPVLWTLVGLFSGLLISFLAAFARLSWARG
jgi:uncharacterized protein involved in exopolysaccharide biosynthesis